MSVLTTMFDRLRSSFRPLRVAVVTPVGPGHAGMYQECRASIEAAWRHGHGPFGALNIIAIDDSAGSLGRSRARNAGIDRAVREGADWLFFLDADDLMVEGAFAAMKPFIAEHDAVWGLILGQSPGAAQPHLRIPQIIEMNRIEDLLLFDPFLTLQMGHFVRAPVAQAIRFDESLDAGEDFDYYLRLWGQYRGAKVAREFFINRHARHSGGPRAASAQDWGTAVRQRQRDARAQHGLDAAAALAMTNQRVGELQHFCRQQGLISSEDFAGVAAQMPYIGEVDVNEYEGGGIVLHTDNDDAICAQLAWTGEYRPFVAALWQSLAQRGGTILDINSGNALFALLAARVSPPATIHTFDVNAENVVRARLNVRLNDVSNIEVIEVTKSEISRLDDYVGGRRLSAVALIRIGESCDALAVLRGMTGVLSTQRPAVLLEVLESKPVSEIVALLRQLGYRCYSVDESRRELAECPAAKAMSVAGVIFASFDSVDDIERLAAGARGRLIKP